MAFKTFVAETTLPAADLNTYLMKQSVIVCTSGTRPASPIEGMTIYETDTDKLLIYTTATTLWNPPWNLPWGYISESKNTSTVTTNSGNLTTVTFTAVQNSRYRVTGQTYGVASTVAGDVAFVTLQDNAGVNFTQQLIECSTAASGKNGSTIVGTITASASGSVTYRFVGGRAAGSGNTSFAAGATNPILLMVEDMGPSAAPV